MHRLWSVAVVSWLMAGGVIAAEAEKEEFRGLWVTRFEWVSPEAEVCKANITRIFEAMAAANFNAAVFQIRGAADTLYPSTLEPWSRLIGGKDPGFDPVAFAIQEARRNGIAFHAYMNPMPLVETSWESPPEDPSHLFNRHGPNSPEPWVCVDHEGRPARSEYYYLSPGIPAVQAHLRKVIMDVVRRYDVDGIHLDRIRYPGEEYSYDAISRRRFVGRGNPNLLDWEDWQRAQLDKLINDLAGEIRAEKPKVVLSCAAWGIYSRHHIDGYDGFSSGYDDFYQDTWKWCRMGAMDVLMPMIYWNMPEPKPNYDELVRDFISGVGADHVVGGQRLFPDEENVNQIRMTREAEALGTVLYSYRSAQRRGVLDRVHEALYQQKVAPPVPVRLRKAEYGTILGAVAGDDSQPLVDALISFKSQGDAEPRRRRSAAQSWTSGEDGRFAFLNVKPGSVQLVAAYDGVPSITSEKLEVRAGEVTRVQLAIPGSGALRDKPYITILSPRDGASTTQESIHLLGRALPGSRVTVQGKAVEVFGTGAFARDDIPLELGENRIEIAAAEGERSASRVITVTRAKDAPEAPTTRPAALRIVEPTGDVALMPGELLTIRLAGPVGRTGQVVLFGGELKLPLAETMSAEGKPTGTYTATARLPDSTGGRKTRIKATLQAGGGAGALDRESTAHVEVWDASAVRVGETTSDDAGINYGLHEVRLGGPWLASVSKGTRFEVVGRKEGMYRIRLSRSMYGWVSERQVKLMPPGTLVPHSYFTSCEASGSDTEDTLAIALSSPVAVAVRSETDPSVRLYIDVFNAHDALTWISHKSGAKIIGAVRSEQIEEDWLRLTVPLKCKQLWGYWSEVKDGRFLLHIRRAPVIAASPDSPLKGLTIAVEAGHGGPTNLGAMGRLGTKEKTVNLQGATALQRELEARGARVVHVRRKDEEITLGLRAARANEANAVFLVSIHANSAGSTRGFLRTSGTSTYYHGVHCRLPAELIYNNLLKLGWNEFGVVGSFSYSPLRNTRVPAILVEQAFMSHPGDEARLLDPDYQRKQAIAIVEGLETFFDRVRE